MVDRVKSELLEIQKDLDRLFATVDGSSRAAKAHTRPDAVPDRKAPAKPQLDQTGGAAGSTWDDVTSGFERSYDELKDSVEKARQWLSDKIEP